MKNNRYCLHYLLYKILGYRFWGILVGIKGFRRTFSNSGYSTHTYVVLSCHPIWSITWIWALYWTKPSKKQNLLSYIFKHKCGFSLATQKPILWQDSKGNKQAKNNSGGGVNRIITCICGKKFRAIYTAQGEIVKCPKCGKEVNA